VFVHPDTHASISSPALRATRPLTHSIAPSARQVIIVAGDQAECGSASAAALGGITLSCDLTASSSCGSNNKNMLACGPFPEQLLMDNAVSGYKVRC